MGLWLTLSQQDKITVGVAEITVTKVHNRAKKVRVRIDAPENVRITYKSPEKKGKTK